MYIEKIYVEESSNDTICDLFLNTPRGLSRSCKTDIILNNLRTEGIYIGNMFGAKGATVQEALICNEQLDNVWFEITMCSLDSRVSVEDVVRLTNECNIIISDHADGGMALGYATHHRQNSLLEWLTAYNIKPKKTVLMLTGDINPQTFKQYKAVNVEHVCFPYWMIIAAGSNPHLAEIHRNPDKLNEYLEPIKNHRKHLGLYPNMKARSHRVYALAVYYINGLLDLLDWSLVDRMPEVSDEDKVRYHLELKEASHGHFDHHAQSAEVKQFLSEVTLPKMLWPADQYVDLLTSPIDFVGKYRYHINVETKYGLSSAVMFPQPHAFLTEKTYKALAEGAIPITLCGGNYVQYLRELGFRMPDMPWCTMTNPEKKIAASAKFMLAVADNDTVFNLDDVIHNAKCMASTQFLANALFSDLTTAVESIVINNSS